MVRYLFDVDVSSNTPSLSSRVASCLTIMLTRSGAFTVKKKLGKLTVRVVAVSCEVLLTFPHRVDRFSQPNFHQFFFRNGRGITP